MQQTLDLVEASIRRGFVATSQGQVHYRVAGSGKPVFLLHPSPFSSRRFEPLLAAMGARRRVYALDTPGYGQSYKPNSPPTLDQYADAVAEAITGLGYERAPLYGDLTGAIIAMSTAIRHPGRVSALCLGVVPFYDNSSRHEAEPRRRGFPTMLHLGPLHADGSHFSELFHRLIDKRVHCIHPEQQFSAQQITEWVIERMEMLEAGTWGFEAVYAGDLADGARQLTCPILIAATETHGNEAQSARGRALLPGYELRQGPQSFLIEEVCAFLAAEIPDFLERHAV